MTELGFVGLPKTIYKADQVETNELGVPNLGNVRGIEIVGEKGDKGTIKFRGKGKD